MLNKFDNRIGIIKEKRESPMVFEAKYWSFMTAQGPTKLRLPVQLITGWTLEQTIQICSFERYTDGRLYF